MRNDSFMLVKVGLVLVFGLFPVLIHGLYEDQVGKWDWRQRYIGRIQSVVPFHLSRQASVVVSTSQNVISSLSILNGSIHWREVLEESDPSQPLSQSQSQSLGGMNLITSPDIYCGVTEAVTDPVVVSVSGNGKYLRRWSSSSGLLLKEASLPPLLVDGASDGSHQLLFSVDADSDSVTVAKLTPLSVEILSFDLSTGSLRRRITTVPSGDWLNDASDCSFVSQKHLVCVDGKNSTLKLLPFQSSSFTSYPLSLFGLKKEGESSHLNLVSFPHQLKSPSPVFTLDLGNRDGFLVLRVVDDEVKMVKILAKVEKLAIVPINLPEEESEQADLAVFALIRKPEELREESVGKLREESVEDETPFKVAVFSLSNWSEVVGLNGQFVMKSSSLVDQFHILPYLRPSQELKHYKILLTMQDESVTLLSSEGEIQWSREESLASIVTAEMIDFPLSELDSSIEQAFGPSSNIVGQFMSRISWQVTQVQSLLTKWMDDVTQLISAPSVGCGEGGLEYSVREKSGLKGKTRDYFGLTKIIVALTATGKVFGLDSVSGRFFWSFYHPELEGFTPSQLSLHILRTSFHFPHPAHAVIVTKKGLLFSFNPLTGVVNGKKRLNESLKQTLLMHQVDETHEKAVVILTDSDCVHVYPESSWPLFASHKEKYFMMVGYPATGILTGYSFHSVEKEGSKVDTFWTTSIPVHDCLDCHPMSITFKRHGEHVHSLGRVLGDRNVMYKYLNPNVAVVVVEGQDVQFSDSLTKSGHLFDLHLIDAVSGRILYSVNHRRSKGPVHVIHSENSIIYSYLNEKSRRTEISALDLYEGSTQSNGTAFSSLDLRTPIVEHSTFIFPTGLRTMVDTVSEKGITNKHILIAISSGGVLELPKAFLDPRRPITPTPEHREEGLIPYMPELPVLSEGLINYNKILLSTKGIQVSPAGLESTCLLFVYGLDTFYTRVMPSKTFDILKDDFDHILILAVLILLISLAYITKWLSCRKILKSAWL